MKEKVNSTRKATWNLVDEVLQKMGWQKVRRTPKLLEFQRGKEKIITWEVTGTRKWKTELFLRNRLEQSTGVHDEYFARIFTMELAMH